MKTFEKFLKSRNGMLSLFGGLVILLLIVAYFSGALGRITGTAGIPYPMPANGYTCLPTCVENDAKMFAMVGSDQASISNAPIKVWIMVPGDQPNFKLGIFDGDSSKNASNQLTSLRKGWNYALGNWDNAMSADTTYTLYADPLADGSGQTVLGSWKGNDVMPNNAWWETTTNNTDQAKSPSNGHYYYRLEATRDPAGKGINAFKVRASGYLMTGLRPEWPVRLVGAIATGSDAMIVYPESGGNQILAGSKSTYDGIWNFSLKITSETRKIEIWDGDFDRAADTDDPNITGKPAWASATTINEGVGVPSGQIDDSSTAMYLRSPAVYYEILDPDGQSIYVNDNPSGSQEWELATISADSADSPDALSTKPFQAGIYTLRIMGLDMQNNVWIGSNYPMCDPNGGCPLMPNEQ